jgi:hypothetical protein
MTDDAALGRLFAGYQADEKLKATEKRLELLLLELLRVADALQDLGLHCAELERKGVQGLPSKSVDVVLRRLLAALRTQQVEPMECKGKPLDLDRHEVVEVKPMPDVPDDIVLEEILRGYVGPDRILRHAKVIISRHESAVTPAVTPAVAPAVARAVAPAAGEETQHTTERTPGRKPGHAPRKRGSKSR